MVEFIHTPDTFEILLRRLVDTPEYFSTKDLALALNYIFTPNAVDVTQTGAFLTALHINRVERRPESLAIAASVLRSRALKVAVDASDTDFLVDIVGTGGDGYNLFNVSTAAAIVAAGAGARVIKHGSRASTSSSGSADLLESLDCLFATPTQGTSTSLPRIPFTFILSPHYHPTLAQLAPIRRDLPFRTMFNVLGPLINPARPRGMVLGVSERELGATFAKSLREGGVERALVVCGFEGLDEISCAGETWAWQLDTSGGITETILNPEMFGVKRHPLRDVRGGTPQVNAQTLRELLGMRDSTEVPQKLMPLLDLVLINASALLVVAGKATDYKEGATMARESIFSGKAWEALMRFRDAGKEAAQGIAVAYDGEL